MTDELNPYRVGGRTTEQSPDAAGPPPTTADFMLELDDVVELSLHSAVGRKQRRTALALLCIVWLSGVVFWLTLKDGLSFGRLFMLVFAVVWSVLLLPPFWRRRIRTACGKIYKDRLPWQQTVVLSSEGISTMTPDSEARHRWQAIQSIRANPTHVFLFLNDAQALVVPARAFRGEAQFHAFVNLAQQFWTAATGRGVH